MSHILPHDKMSHLTGSNLHYHGYNTSFNQSQSQYQHHHHMANLTPQKQMGGGPTMGGAASMGAPAPGHAAIDPGLARLFVSPTAEDLQRRRQRQRQQGLPQRSPQTPATPSTPQPMGRGGGGGGGGGGGRVMGDSPLPNPPSFDGPDEKPLAGESLVASPISAR